MVLTLFGCAILAKVLLGNLREIIEGFLTFFGHVMGWAKKMVNKFADLLRRGLRKLFVVDFPAEQIPPGIIPKEKLAKAKKIPLGVLTDSEGTPLEVDTMFVPTQGMDREFRHHLDEGGGAIELCA